MFKLESYVTPLLLSYVNKYIKNLKPEDSQFSLWGGDASFCNLDLRLDVLEQELDLPFTFVNGHIHELRIHVPWTKLGSEPIVITINTIECILKLHSISNGASSDSINMTRKQMSLAWKAHKKEEISEAPPGYVQSLINRVISNITIVCNNLILKYVEDDIVLSLNVKAAELFNVNEKWERTFVDFSLSDNIVRKVISMQDLTVCLDKRDACGKIEAYQDPLLYRCSTIWRIYNLYNTPHSKYPSVTRINIFCDKLDFSLTDQQLPMFIRLLKLSYALQYKDACLNKEISSEDENKSQAMNEDFETLEQQSDLNDSWGTWMWSFVPFSWSENDEESSEESEKMKLQKILQFGVFIDKASCVFKSTEVFNDACDVSSKFILSPFGILDLYGCSMEITNRGKEFFNVQLGVTGATISGMKECICGFKEFDGGTKMEGPFVRAGVAPGIGNSYNFLSSTLFDPLANENCGQRRKYSFDKEVHLSQFTDDVLVRRFPAFALDYIYYLIIPEEWIDKASLVTSTFLEDSNWHESSVFRVAIGPFCADINSSFFHLLQKLSNCIMDYEYPIYMKPESGTEQQRNPNAEQDDVRGLEEFVPLRCYQLSLFKPVLRFSVADHHYFDVSTKHERRKIKKTKRKYSRVGQTLKSAVVPLYLEIRAEKIELQVQCPMYPQRVTKIVSLLSVPSTNLVTHCFNYSSFKLSAGEIRLLKDLLITTLGSIIMPPTSISYKMKFLCYPKYFRDCSFYPEDERVFDCQEISVSVSEESLLSLICIYQSWMEKDFNFDCLSAFATSKLKRSENTKLILQMSVLHYIHVKTKSYKVFKGQISTMCIKLQCSSKGSSTTLLQAPEDTNEIYKGETLLSDDIVALNSNYDDFKWLQFIVQIPNESTKDSLMVATMRGGCICLDPALMTWLTVEASTLNLADIDIHQADCDDISTCSSQTPVASGSLSLNRSKSIIETDCIGSIFEEVERFIVQKYKHLQHLTIQVQMDSLVLLFPKFSWCSDGSKERHLVKTWKSLISKKKLTAPYVLCLPKVFMANNCAQNFFEEYLNVYDTPLPITLAKGSSKHDDNFPWSLQIHDVAMYTVNNISKSEQIYFLLDPTTISATIAISSKQLDGNQLALCIHVDTSALKISLSSSQVIQLAACIETFSTYTHVSTFVKNWMSFFVQKSAESFLQISNNKPLSFKKCNDTTPEIHRENEGKLLFNENYVSDTSKEVNIPRRTTLWIQLTLSKFEMNFYGRLNEDNECFKTQFICEEVITSLDIQDVYSKAKIKISSLNGNFFLKSINKPSWCQGPYGGIVLCSSQKIRRHIKSTNTDAVNLSHRSNIKIENQPFLLFTFTKALCKNANQKWTANGEDSLKMSCDEDKYISEVDISVRQFDVILWIPLFKAIYNAFKPLREICINLEECNEDMPQDVKFSNQTLPLVYVRTNDINFFIPKYKTPSLLLCEDVLLSAATDDPFRKFKPDMLCFHLGQINLTSQVENPLSRIILNPDLYTAAVKSRTICIPGSDVEDRQYHLDMHDLSISSVLGCMILKSNPVFEEKKFLPPVISENPALQWNIGVINDKRKFDAEDPLMIVPFLSSLDINMTVAPAIISNITLQTNVAAALVSGITVEMSIANDISAYVSARQLDLITTIVDNSIVIPTPEQFECGFEVNVSNSDSLFSPETQKDSGISSDTSTILHFLKSPSYVTKSDIFSIFIPFEVLITACSVSFILFDYDEDVKDDYSQEYYKESTNSTNDGSWYAGILSLATTDDVKNITSQQKSSCFEEASSSSSFKGQDVSHEAFDNYGNTKIESSLKSTSKDKPKIFPMFFISILQPHTYLKCLSSSQKFEASCFDFSIKGTGDRQPVEMPDNFSIPLQTHFNVCYLETRPGEVNEKTGIPPSFCTLSSLNFLCGISEISLCIERPFKLRLSYDLWKQLEMLYLSVENKLLFKKQHLKKKEQSSTVIEHKSTLVKLLLYSLSQIGGMQFSTTNIVVEYNTIISEQILILGISLGYLNANMTLKSIEFQKMISCFNIKDVAVKLIVGNETWPFILPFSAKIGFDYQLLPYSKLIANIDFQAVIINCNLKSLSIVSHITKNLYEFLNIELQGKFFNSSSHLESNIASIANKNNIKKLCSYDDLRKGSFCFIQSSNKENSKPNVHEIVFTKAQLDAPAAMTWRYPETRTLMKINVSPVPYNYATDIEEDDPQKIPCSVQYWDTLQQKFVTKCQFLLSESSHHNMDFSLLNTSITEFSEVWRVVIETENVFFPNSDRIISPLALAACMCIDSCFNPELVPRTQLIVSSTIFKVNLYNTFIKTTNSWNKLLPFEFDDSAYVNQDFMNVLFDKSEIQFTKWETGLKLTGSSEFSCSIIEYDHLTMFPVIDPVAFKLNAYQVSDSNISSITKLEMSFEPLFVRVSQSSIHTLKYALHNCPINDGERGGNYHFEYMLPNYYIICNSTMQIIRFGQADTDECIILPPQNMHAYSWRSRNSKKLLHISLETDKCKWSRAFKIDECGVQKISLENNCSMHIKIKSLSNLQKEIIFAGPVSLLNIFDQKLCIAIKSIEPGHIQFPEERIYNSVIPERGNMSFVISPHMNIYLSLKEYDSNCSWSEWFKILNSDKNESVVFSLAVEQNKSIFIHTIKIKESIGFSIGIFLCPLFIIRNHLPGLLTENVTMGFDEVSCINIPGKGQETQVLNPSWLEKNTTLKFDFNNTVDITGTNIKEFFLDQDLDSSVLKQLFEEINTRHSFLWPYGNFEESSNCTICENNYLLNSNSSIIATVIAKNPKIICDVRQRWKYSNTALIDIKPWALIINKLDLEIEFADSNKMAWKLPPNSVFVPPCFEYPFYLHFKIDNVQYSSAPIYMLEENCKLSVNNGYALYIPGSIVISIYIKNNKLLLLHLSCKLYDEIHVMTVHPLVQLKNDTQYKLHLSLSTSVNSFHQKADHFKNCEEIVVHGNGTVKPIFVWGDSLESILRTSDINKTYIFCVAICLCDDSKHSWSYPLQISSNSARDVRYNVSVPVSFSTIPFVLTVHKRHELFFLTIVHDSYPLLHLHNRTKLQLYYGQSLTDSKDSKDNVHEETDGMLIIPSLTPGASAYYTFPAFQYHYPTCMESLPKIKFGCVGKDSIKFWSPAVDICLDNQFLYIPGICYIRVSRLRKEHTINLHVDVVNRIEFTAEEVRNRIGSANDLAAKQITFDFSLENENEKCLSDQNEITDEYVNEIEYKKNNIQTEIFQKPDSFCLNLRLLHVSIIVCDEFVNCTKVIEVLRVNIDDAILYSHPKEPLSILQLFCLSFGHIQIDNQIDQEDATVFDFPVVLKPRINSEYFNTMEEGTDFFPNKLNGQAFATINIVFELFTNENSWTIQTVDIHCKSISLFLEDALYYKLLRLYQSYIPYSFHEHEFINNCTYFPRDISCISYSQAHPLRIREISININEVFLTIHASLKLYFSIENSMLKFEPFQRQELFTDFYNLGHVIIVHYLTGALFQAGWVVGALDILGNPANFARAVGTGIADFIRLPYRGFLNGPRCFLAGLSHGASSLISGISSGAILCVTNLAASISRNMDLLSLDPEHLARQESLRRHLPLGVTRGLLQGLSGLGISLLGAIAGVVDHPLQVFISSSSPIDTAKGVVSGFGKGLIGFITKPVGGAAEFVSQTGHGLLQGAGWLYHPKRMYLPVNISVEQLSCSSLKLRSKIVQTAALGEFFLSVNAQLLDEESNKKDILLLLTSEVVCVIDSDEEVDQKTFTVPEIKCQKSDEDLSAIIINVLEKPDGSLCQDACHIKSRVADYIQKNWLQDSENSQPIFPDERRHSNDVEHTFFVNPNMRELFLAVFDAAKRKCHCKGFSVC